MQEYQRAADKKQFRRKHEGTLILYEAAAKALKEQGFQKLPDLYALKDEYKQLAEQKDQLQRQYAEAKRQMQEYGIIKQNVDGILRTTPGKEQTCNGVQREHNKKLNNGLPILHKVPPKRDYGRYFCIMAEKGGTSHGGLTEKLSPFFHAKKQEVNAYGR